MDVTSSRHPSTTKKEWLIFFLYETGKLLNPCEFIAFSSVCQNLQQSRLRKFRAGCFHNKLCFQQSACRRCWCPPNPRTESAATVQWWRLEPGWRELSKTPAEYVWDLPSPRACREPACWDCRSDLWLVSPSKKNKNKFQCSTLSGLNSHRPWAWRSVRLWSPRKRRSLTFPRLGEARWSIRRRRTEKTAEKKKIFSSKITKTTFSQLTLNLIW